MIQASISQPKCYFIIRKKNPEKIRTLLRDLFTEAQNVTARIETFRCRFKRLNKKNFPNTNDYQDHRAISVYLALRFPENYFFYKFQMFKAFTEKVCHSYTPIPGKIDNVIQFYCVCKYLRDNYLSKDEELLEQHRNSIDNDCYPDHDLNILTQDFVFAVAEYLDLNNLEPETAG